MDRVVHKNVLTAFAVILCGTFALWPPLTPPAPADDAPAAGNTIRVDVSRDDWTSSVGHESEGNNGGASQLKTKGSQEYTLIDIDPKPLVGHVITSATLHLHCVSPDSPQKRLTVSSVSSDWGEGTGTNYTVQPGSACFNWAEEGKKPWSFPGSDLTSVTNAMGNTIWRFADATPPDADGWQTVAVDPRVLATRVAGIGYGFQVFDDVGSEYSYDGHHFEFHNFLNRFVSSRDGNKKFAPYFTVTLGAEDHEAPEAPGAIVVESTPEPSGEALVSWTTPTDHGPAGTLGFLVRYMPPSGASDADAAAGWDWDHATPVPHYLVPMAGKPGDKVVMHLRDLKLAPGATILLGVRAVDAAGNLSTATTGLVKTSLVAPVEIKPQSVQPFAAGGENPKVGGVEVAIVDALDKMEAVSGRLVPAEPEGYLTGNHLWSASEKKIRLFAARNEFVAFQVLLMGQAKGIGVKIHFDGQPDSPPSAAEKYAGQKNPVTDLYRLAYVPEGGGYWPDPLLPMTGPIDLPATDHPIAGQKSAGVIADVYVPHEMSPGKHAGTLEISVGSEKFTIPIELNVWDFTLPDEVSFIAEMNCYGLPSNDLPYYRLAQVNRVTLNRLGYNWHGKVADNCGPKLTGGKMDWTAYDKHYGPIFDGSAFDDLPRKGVPVDTQYLPLCESFPVSVSAFKGGYWADQAFPQSYWNQFIAGCREYAQHFHDKNWTHTLFELYLNGKVYYKKADNWNNCSAPWCFDEPANTQDFWALRQYGVAYHRGVDPVRGDVKMVFRCDISRSEFQRDMLDDVQDVDVVGGSFREYLRSIMDRKARDGEITLNYGSANPINASNYAPVAWAINTWCLGGDGITPWQTIGNAKSWKQGDSLSIFYPPLDSSGQPIISVRLKAFRRGQQDAEYLTMLGLAGNHPRFAVAQAAEQAADLTAKLSKTSESDAGTVSFNSVRPEQLWALRVRLGATLDAMHPPVKRQWLDLRPPKHDMDALPEMGYIQSK